MISDRTTTLLPALTIDHVAAVVGCANGLKTPAARVVITVEDAPERLQALGEAIATLAGILDVRLPPPDPRSAETAPAAEALLRAFVATLTAALVRINACLAPETAGLPQCLRIEPPTRAPDRPATRLFLVWPTDWPHLLAQVLKWSLDLCRAFAEAPAKSDVVEAGRRTWQQIGAQLGQTLPSGTNMPRLLRAARSLKVPVLWLGRDVMQVGHGRQARLLRRTLTDATPSLGVTIARDKTSTAQFLRLAGIPTPLHVEVADAAAAVAAAERLGWPVVVKPADQDYGAGARADLRDHDQVVSAFANAEQVSKRILVEQHIAGKEFRLTVVDGELFWAHERIPASVVGDGVSSIASLIEWENERRIRALRTDANGLKPIELKAADTSFLLKTGWSLTDIPGVLLDGVPDQPLIDALSLVTLRADAQYREPWPARETVLAPAQREAAG